MVERKCVSFAAKRMELVPMSPAQRMKSKGDGDGEGENGHRKDGSHLYLRTSEVVFLLDFAKLFDISHGLLAYVRSFPGSPCCGCI